MRGKLPNARPNPETGKPASRRYDRLMKDRAELDALIRDLDRQVPKLIAAPVEEADRIAAFAEHADNIMDAAAPEDRGYAFTALEAIALRHGLVLPAKGTV